MGLAVCGDVKDWLPMVMGSWQRWWGWHWLVDEWLAGDDDHWCLAVLLCAFVFLTVILWSRIDILFVNQ